MTVAADGRAQRVDTSVRDSSATVADLQHEISGLREAMASRAPIEQAKGMVMLRYGVDEDAAFRVLRKWSSVHNVKLRVVAAALIELWLSEPTPADSATEPGSLLAAALSSPPPSRVPPSPVQDVVAPEVGRHGDPERGTQPSAVGDGSTSWSRS